MARGRGSSLRAGKSRATSRKRASSKRLAARESIPKFKEHSFQAKIKQITNKVSPKYQIQPKALTLLNSFLNDIVKNVILKAKEKNQSTRKNILTYTDVYVSAMNLFGDENKWIKNIMQTGEEKSKLYETKIRFTMPSGGKLLPDER